MNRLRYGIFSCCLALAAVCLPAADAQAVTYKHVTLTGQSAAGYTYSGTGWQGIPGTTNPDSRRRPKIYNDFASFDTSAVGDTLSMTYDLLMGGDADPSNESQDWRFGFIGTSANGGKGVSLGFNLDIGDLAGSTYYEFFTDAAVTTGLGTPPSGTMDSAFTSTLNDTNDGTARIAQSANDPFANDVALNDRTDTHQIVLTLERVANGYDLSWSFQNLVSTNTINHATTVLTDDPDPSVALAAGVTSWDRLGFFVNDNNIDSAGPWTYTLSNLGVEGNASPLALASTWTPNEYQIPEPASSLLLLFALSLGALGRQRK